MSRVIRVRYVGKHAPEYETIRRALAASQIVNVADSDRQAAHVLRGVPVPGFVRVGLAPKQRETLAGALAKLPRSHLNG